MPVSGAQASRTPTLAEVLRVAIEYRIADMHTCLPGKITKWDAAKQLAEVEILTKRVAETADGGEPLVESFPILPEVPVMFPRAGGFFMSFPVTVGDNVLLVFGERSTDEFSVSDGRTPVTPADPRMHALSDPVALLGYYPLGRSLSRSDVHAQNMVVGHEGGSPQIHLKPSGEIHIGKENATDYVSLAALVGTELNRIKADILALKTATDTAFAALSPIIDAKLVLTTTAVPITNAFTAATVIIPTSPASVAASKTKAV